MGDAADTSEQLNVLIVDDDPAMRELLVEIMHRHGHQAISADSAEKALELLVVWTFEVAFLDQNLPGLEGLLLGEYLRRSNPNMLVALVTGEQDPRLEKRSKDLDVTFIAKPFDNADIHRVLQTYAELAKERGERRAEEADVEYDPPFHRFADELAEVYGVPNVPGRVVDRLVGTVQRSLSNLRSVSRYNERDRVVALSGLLAARVLGVDLPKASSGLTLYEEYDRLMREHGRRPEFGG